ncbi:lipoprotein-releasing ABC transporter ATP-binding protein LolD [uncultured Methylophaga sp.]|uniref:lipoprotein-releasing ABC transporter ATP-binding protein LolD n=1 Tax=uncultured Methylophaga sp. TaxID=285271 RepID=UPI00261133AB|nr:lipoprotein-releasing ABC transporter ATP-binding protein LolD [uncultured Methylophaga sp.]
MTDAVLTSINLAKSFTDGGLQTHVLDNINLSVHKGDRLAIVGSSGSGKSTLLHLLGGLDTPSQGQVLVNGEDIHALNHKAASRLRNQQLGFVYQFHHLLPEFTAVENVAMPLVIGGEAPIPAQQKASDLLEKVGLGHRLEHKPSELSGGERQRAAMARALITEPACLLADEPTGNLDHRTAQSMFDLLLQLNADLGTALVIVTHDTELAGKMDRIMTLMDGVLQSES